MIIRTETISLRSMLSDLLPIAKTTIWIIKIKDSGFGSGRLLDDLFAYVFNDNNCRVILLGDSAQLPPIGTALSPALDEAYLQAYGMKVYSCELSEVVRQDADSGILYNATMLRKMMSDKNIEFPQIKTTGFPEIHSITGAELIEEIENSWDDVWNID